MISELGGINPTADQNVIKLYSFVCVCKQGIVSHPGIRKTISLNVKTIIIIIVCLNILSLTCSFAHTSLCSQLNTVLMHS